MTALATSTPPLAAGAINGPSADRLAEAFDRALCAAQGFVGATAPNPAVGCVLLDARGEVLACEAHRKAGEPHAEAAALAECRRGGLIERVHTALVTLEPCSHHGRTPPCVEALISSPVRQVWVGAMDPHPRAPGVGAARLSAGGVGVHEIADLPHPSAAALAARAARLIAPFARWSRTGRPWVAVKIALTREGSMIPPPGRVTFTSAESLKLAHRWRRESDAILTGSGCVLADNPAFTVRHVPDHVAKRRRLAILDRRRRVGADYLRAAEARGFDVSVHEDVAGALDELGAAGVLQALVEAGPTLTTSILESGLWDESLTIRQGAKPCDPDVLEIATKNPLVDKG
jgi:diaminohydroxyphosphoribosylaminopyrimidine deaminase/5-amino-6-(5-phosphoribosylamino)uracil reductase